LAGDCWAELGTERATIRNSVTITRKNRVIRSSTVISKIIETR
jgi:hypothetical protein